MKIAQIVRVQESHDNTTNRDKFILVSRLEHIKLFKFNRETGGSNNAIIGNNSDEKNLV